MTKPWLIEIDEAMAERLDSEARERGVSVSDLLGQLLDEREPAGRAAEIAELDRRWARVEAGEPTVAHEDVVEWLRTWGTPACKPWHER